LLKKIRFRKNFGVEIEALEVYINVCTVKVAGTWAPAGKSLVAEQQQSPRIPLWIEKQGRPHTPALTRLPNVSPNSNFTVSLQRDIQKLAC
jgi:hypothetical protein